MAHYEDCKFFLKNACSHGHRCAFRHSEAACHTDRVCNRWAAGHICDGRCNLRHPSAADLAALATATPLTAARANAKHQFVATSSLASPPPSATAGPQIDGFADATPSPPPCRFHARGRCAKGNACPFAHAPRQPPSWPSTATATTAPTLRAAAAAARAAGAAASPISAKAMGAPVENVRTKKSAVAGVPAGDGRRVGGVPSAGGTGVEEIAAAEAKAKAAIILQKHRFSSSAQAVQAAARGGMHVKRKPATAGGKRPRSGDEAQAQSPSDSATMATPAATTIATRNRSATTGSTERATAGSLSQGSHSAPPGDTQSGGEAAPSLSTATAPAAVTAHLPTKPAARDRCDGHISAENSGNRSKTAGVARDSSLDSEVEGSGSAPEAIASATGPSMKAAEKRPASFTGGQAVVAVAETEGFPQRLESPKDKTNTGIPSEDHGISSGVFDDDGLDKVGSGDKDVAAIASAKVDGGEDSRNTLPLAGADAATALAGDRRTEAPPCEGTVARRLNPVC